MFPMFIPIHTGGGGGPPLGPKAKAAFAMYCAGIAGSLIYHVNKSVSEDYYRNAYGDAVIVGTFEGLAKGAIWPIYIIALPGYLYKRYNKKK